MSRILILGGHGKIALLTAPLLRERGDEVVSLIRNPDHQEDVERAGATARVADLEQLSVEDMAEQFAGFDAIVWSAGAGGGNPERTRAVDHDAAVRSMKAANQAGVRRYIMVSYFRASRDHGVSPDNSFFAYAEAKAAADEYLRSSDLDWTVLGPSLLTLEPASGKIDTEATESGEVSRGNVAQVIAAVLHEDASIHKTIRFNDGQTAIADAFAR